MKGIWTTVLVAAACLAAGCQDPNKNADARTEENFVPPPQDSLDRMDSTGGGTTNGSSAYAGATYRGGTYTAGASAADDTGTMTAADPAPTYTGSPPTAQPRESSVAADEPLTPTGGKTYVVRKGDTLSKISMLFYNDKSRWRAIWQANKTRVPNPDRITEGTKLIIP